MTRPLNVNAYENETNIFRLAAVYGIGIAKNHAFLDGNKRTAFLAIGLFLRLNVFNLVASPKDATAIMLKVANNEITESELTIWIAKNINT